MEELLTTTLEQRIMIAEYASTLIDSKDSKMIVKAVGESMQQLEFDLNELEPIKSFRALNPEATLETFYLSVLRRN